MKWKIRKLLKQLQSESLNEIIFFFTLSFFQLSLLLLADEESN